MTCHVDEEMAILMEQYREVVDEWRDDVGLPPSPHDIDRHYTLDFVKSTVINEDHFILEGESGAIRFMPREEYHRGDVSCFDLVTFPVAGDLMVYIQNPTCPAIYSIAKRVMTIGNRPLMQYLNTIHH